VNYFFLLSAVEVFEYIFIFMKDVCTLLYNLSMSYIVLWFIEFSENSFGSYDPYTRLYI
jgi:hypothetical protein